MTNRERQMKSMLNYYGIDMGGTKDEKMSKTEMKKFLDTFNGFYDDQTVREIVERLKNKLDQNLENPFDEKESEENPLDFNSMDDDSEPKDPNFEKFPLDLNSLSNRTNGFNANDWANFSYMNINPEIEKFISWIYSVLYSADHKVVISEEDNVTIIRLEKTKKKRGGRKK